MLMQNFADLTYGADPEVFAIDKNSLAYSPGILEYWEKIYRVNDTTDREPYEKEKHPIYIRNEDFWWIMDGVAFELTFLKPYKNPGAMSDTCNKALEELKYYLSKIEVDKNPLELYTRSVVNIDPEIYIPHLTNDLVYQGFIFGCDPDLDVTEDEYICRTEDVTRHKFRYGGGHFHFGGNSDQRDFMHTHWKPFVQLLAISVGNICVVESICPDEDRQRVGKYGRPGRYRMPPHGIEYRSPSNAWINDTPKILPKIFRGGALAFEWLIKENYSVIERFFNPTCDAINTINQPLAQQILNDLGI